MCTSLVTELPIKAPQIYVACLASEERGIFHGVWVNATLPLETIQKQIDEMIEKSPIPDAERYAIRSYRGFGSFELAENESIEFEVRIKALLFVKYGELASRIFDYCNKDLDDTVLALTHHYIGAYASERDFAVTLFNQSYLKNPDTEIEPYLNYNQFRKHIFECDYFSLRIENKSHVFVRH